MGFTLPLQLLLLQQKSIIEKKIEKKKKKQEENLTRKEQITYINIFSLLIYITSTRTQSPDSRQHTKNHSRWERKKQQKKNENEEKSKKNKRLAQSVEYQLLVISYYNKTIRSNWIENHVRLKFEAFAI